MKLVALIVLAVVLALATTALADPITLRLKLRPSSGELTKTTKPCGTIIQNELWKRISDAPWIEIINNVMRGATKNTKGDPFIGEYAFEYKTYTIAVTLPKSRRQRSTVVSFTVLYTLPLANETCTEKWLGLGEQW